MEWIVESETKTSVVTWQHANSKYCCWKFRVCGGVWELTRIKLSNAGDCYLWNITSDILPDGSCMDMTAYQQGLFFTTQSASTSQQDSPDLNLTPRLLLLCARHKKKADRGVRFKSGLSARVFFIQSRRIDHKHGKMLSDHRDAGLEQIWPRMADENLPTNLLIFCYLVKKTTWIDFLICYQLIENKGLII